MIRFGHVLLLGLATILCSSALSARADWDTLSADEKRLFTRRAEVFAGFVEMTDHEIGRVVDAIEQTGERNDTLIFFAYGDNGTAPRAAATACSAR